MTDRSLSSPSHFLHRPPPKLLTRMDLILTRDRASRREISVTTVRMETSVTTFRRETSVTTFRMEISVTTFRRETSVTTVRMEISVTTFRREISVTKSP